MVIIGIILIILLLIIIVFQLAIFGTSITFVNNMQSSYKEINEVSKNEYKKNRWV